MTALNKEETSGGESLQNYRKYKYDTSRKYQIMKPKSEEKWK